MADPMTDWQVLDALRQAEADLAEARATIGDHEASSRVASHVTKQLRADLAVGVEALRRIKVRGCGDWKIADEALTRLTHNEAGTADIAEALARAERLTRLTHNEEPEGSPS